MILVNLTKKILPDYKWNLKHLKKILTACNSLLRITTTDCWRIL